MTHDEHHTIPAADTGYQPTIDGEMYCTECGEYFLPDDEQGIEITPSTSGHFEAVKRETTSDVYSHYDAGDTFKVKITPAPDSDELFIRDGIISHKLPPFEVKRAMKLKKETIPDCDYGCGNEAKYKNFPVIVNGRLYHGPVCEDCALIGGANSIKEALELMKDAFRPGAPERDELEREKDKDHEVFDNE